MLLAVTLLLSHITFAIVDVLPRKQAPPLPKTTLEPETLSDTTAPTPLREPPQPLFAGLTPLLPLLLLLSLVELTQQLCLKPLRTSSGVTTVWCA